MFGTRCEVSRAVVAAVALLIVLAAAWSASAALLDPTTQPKFVNPLPIPSAVDMTKGGSFHGYMKQLQQDLGIKDPITGDPMLTTVWGYQVGTVGPSYPGPTIVVRQNVAVDILWDNALVDGNGVPLPHLFPIDTTLFKGVTPTNWPACGTPTVVHVHGGHTESASDGTPLQWFTPGFAQKGQDWVKETFHYDNDQQGSTIWYHDHAMAFTRQNAYAGLAGFYLIRDANEEFLVRNKKLPSGSYEIGLAFQDKMFTDDGSLYYPTEPEFPGAPDPSIHPEMFGDFILVNGKTWPVLDVEPRQYRFRMLNGADSRFFDMTFVRQTGTGPVPQFIQIGTEDGMLQTPLFRSNMLIAPGERYDVVIDFSNKAFKNQTFILTNAGRAPYPTGDPVDPNTTGLVMAFRVVKPLNRRFPPTMLPSNLRPISGPIQNLVQSGPTRELLLWETVDEFGRTMPVLGTAAAGMIPYLDPVTETPMLNDTEVWEIYNTTVDGHPIHLHLASFQLLDRQPFVADQDTLTGALTNIIKYGTVRPAPAEERGFKDTVVMMPGEVTRVIAKFDKLGLYVWHCHILSHEEHDMMRPIMVMPPVVAKGQDGAASPAEVSMALESSPNPFSSETDVRFALPKASRIELRVFNLLGQEVRTIASGQFEAGKHTAHWDGRDNFGSTVASGVYFYRLQSQDAVRDAKAVLMRR